MRSEEECRVESEKESVCVVRIDWIEESSHKSASEVCCVEVKKESTSL